MTFFHDRAQITGPARITPEGYFVADALVARANNIQTYTAGELGIADRDPGEVVRVYRPAEQVFAADSLMTAARLPITMDHPVKSGTPVFVDAANWREFACGQTDDKVLRDGEFVRVPLRITDSDAVASVQSDRREFSLGYGADIQFTPGVVADGEFAGQAYDAIAANFRYNHLAACRTARGGAELRIVDERRNPIPEGPKMPKLVMVDGLPVDVSDAAAAEATISKLVGDRAATQAEVVDLRGQVSTAGTTLAARDAEIVGLKDQVKAAQVTPQALRDAAASYGRTVTLAKAMGATVTDAMDEPAVRQAAVTHKMGDAAKDYDAKQVSAAFDALAAQLPATATGGAAPVRDSLRNIIAEGPAALTDATTAAATARDHRLRRFETAHLGPQASKPAGPAN